MARIRSKTITCPQCERPARMLVRISDDRNRRFVCPTCADQPKIIFSAESYLLDRTQARGA